MQVALQRASGTDRDVTKGHRGDQHHDGTHKPDQVRRATDPSGQARLHDLHGRRLHGRRLHGRVLPAQESTASADAEAAASSAPDWRSTMSSSRAASSGCSWYLWWKVSTMLSTAAVTGIPMMAPIGPNRPAPMNTAARATAG